MSTIMIFLAMVMGLGALYMVDGEKLGIHT
jgi:hypothetical protein